MLAMTKLPFNRPLAAIVLLTFCVSVGCSSWGGVLVDNVMSDEAESLIGKRVRLYTHDPVQEMTVNRVEFPFIEGTISPSATTTIRVDLREVRRIEVHHYTAPARNIMFVVVVLGAVAFLILTNPYISGD